MIYYQPARNSVYVQGHEWTFICDVSENQVILFQYQANMRGIPNISCLLISMLQKNPV